MEQLLAAQAREATRRGHASPVLSSWAAVTRKPVVLRVCADPGPQYAARNGFPESAIVVPYTNGPVATNPLEVRRRVMRIAYKQFIVDARQGLDFRR